MLQITLPAAKGTSGDLHPATQILTGKGFAVTEPGVAANDAIIIGIENGLTNQRGTDAALTRWFSDAVKFGQQQGTLPQNLNIEFVYSGPDIKRENSKLNDESWEKDLSYKAKFHDTAKGKRPDLVFVSGWEPENSNDPTDILNDVRAGQALEVIKEAEKQNIPTILSCRAAHLWLNHLANQQDENRQDKSFIELLPKKLKSIVSASVNEPREPVAEGFAETIRMPMSRLCAFAQSAMDKLINNKTVKEIARSGEAGTIIARHNNHTLISGHPECRREDIEGEDERDRGRNVGKPKEQHLEATKNIEHVGKAERDGLQFGVNLIKLAIAHRKAAQGATTPAETKEDHNFIFSQTPATPTYEATT